MASDRRRRLHRIAGALLALIVLGFHQGAIPRPGSGAATGAPGALFELILPGVFADRADTAISLLGTTRPAAGTNLAAHALLHGAAPPTPAALYVGLAPLLLALMASFTARGAWAALARVALMAGLAMVSGWIPTGSIGAPLLVAALAGLAGLGLGALSDDAAGAGAPAVSIGAASVGLAAVLGAFALQAGAIPAAGVAGPLLQRLPARETELWSVTAIAGNAAHLRAVLDRSALAAFATMTALLLHLKGRARWSLGLLLLVVAADLISARIA